MQTRDYISRLKAHFSVESDYALAKKLKIERATVSGWQRGGTMSDDLAVFAAELLGIPPAQALIDMRAERTKSPHLRRIWRDAAAQLTSCYAKGKHEARP